MLRKELKHGQVFRYYGESLVIMADDGSAIFNPNYFQISSNLTSSRLDETVELLDQNGKELTEQNAIDPAHYKNLTPEPIDVTEGWGLNPNLASVIWYIARAGKKNHTGNAVEDAKTDLQKAARFLSREIARLEGRRSWT